MECDSNSEQDDGSEDTAVIMTRIICPPKSGSRKMDDLVNS